MGNAIDCLVGPPHPALSPRPAVGEGRTAGCSERIWRQEWVVRFSPDSPTRTGEREGPIAGKETRRYPDRPIVGVLAVVMRGDRALVVRRANPPMPGRWGFPGGVLELGETVADGAMRELFEETGVIALAGETLTVIDTIDRDAEDGVRYHYTLVAVRGIWQEGEGFAGDDADEVAWLTRAEIVDGGLPTAPALLPLIDLALARRG